MRKFVIWSSIIVSVVVGLLIILYWTGKLTYESYALNISNLRTSSVASTENLAKQGFKNLMEQRISRAQDYGISVLDTPVLLNNDESFKLIVNMPERGLYYAILKYRYTQQLSSTGALEVNVNSVPYLAILDNYSYYNYSEKVYDRYGNEITPEQIPFDDSFVSYLKDSHRIGSLPILFELNDGDNEIEIKNTRRPIILEGLYFVPISKEFSTVSYAKYIESNPKKNDIGNEKPILIEAEHMAFKSDSLVSIVNEQTAQVSPYELLKKKVNVIDENTFKQSGQEVHWSFYIQEPGYYKIAFRYKQSLNRGVPVYRRIYIDGKVPFTELMSYKFPFTGFKWVDFTLSDNNGKPYEIYLDKGYHTLSLEVTTGVYEESVRFLQDSVKTLQAIGLDIRKLVGNNLDPNRTWNIEKYLPNVVSDLKSIATNLRLQHNKLIGIVGQKGLPSIADMLVCAGIIENILKRPERIPFYLDVISEGAASVAQRLSELSMNLRNQPMGIDRVLIYQGESEKYIPKANAFLISAYEELHKLWLSFFNKNEAYSIYEKVDERSLRIWVNRPIQYVETLQYLTDTDFTRKTGIKVVFSAMPNEQRLILASAAGNAPDVALSISNWIPFELAIRNALYPLSSFPDFYSFVSNNINVETLLPMVIEDKVYGITETQNFYVLFYRKDILDKLGIPVPNTWDDVKKILPELQRRGMNFSIPMCEQTTKYFNTTAPFFFQNNARLYTEDGVKTAINTEEGVKSFELMTEIFTIFGIPEQVANFYNSFRYGRIPIGVGDFGLYVTLMNAADEIYGLWDIAPSPGVVDEEGNVLRYQVAGDRADVIFATSEKKEKAWEFIKWWMSKETQLKFARTLINRYGPLYIWNTANIEAFKELDFIDERHKKVVLEQWRWIREVQRHPGGYMTEREISNIWNRVVVEGAPLRTAIDRSVILINRELERKLTEFGYIREGKVLKNYRMYDSMEEFMRVNNVPMLNILKNVEESNEVGNETGNNDRGDDTDENQF